MCIQNNLTIRTGLLFWQYGISVCLDLVSMYIHVKYKGSMINKFGMMRGNCREKEN